MTITYIRLHPGFVYLVAIIDWFSRFVLSWEVSITLESNFCVAALDWALQLARPDIFNTDQGAQRALTYSLEGAAMSSSAMTASRKRT